MPICKSLLAALIVLACVVLDTPATHAQCAVINRMTSSFPSFNFKRITKTLSMSGNCTVLTMNAFGCGEAPGVMSATQLIASAYTMGTMATANPFCSWECNCGPGYTMVPIRTDSSDGLPVELLDFKVSALDSSRRASPLATSASETVPPS